MKWRGGRRSENVEDRRGRIPGGGMALGGGGLLIVLLVVLLGGDPQQVLEQIGQTGGGAESEYVPSAEENELAEFVAVVLAETEDVWRAQFAELGQEYPEPGLVLFTQRVESACGMAAAAMGPFYCPLDARVYVDLAFYEELHSRFGAPGDFAQAYVIAHEVGHHVQNVLGIMDRVQRMRGRVSEAEYNDLSVRLELQADYFSGVWAHHAQATKGILEPGDIEEALRAASAIGDDRLQMESQGYVVPDAFTHGTSEQRVRWFRRGYESGRLADGDTFAAESL